MMLGFTFSLLSFPTPSFAVPSYPPFSSSIEVRIAGTQHHLLGTVIPLYGLSI